MLISHVDSGSSDPAFAAIEEALQTGCAELKCQRVAALSTPAVSADDPPEVRAGNLTPGRPPRPVLVHPSRVARRRLNSVQGRVALVHAVAHIEFNAINLALDAAWRFRGMPPGYYDDWLRVARDEARHFGWLRQRLLDMGSDYGELEAHNGLWEAAVKTAADPLVRMALVPRVLEARGLDVTPGMINRLARSGDHETVAILERILEEEVCHVEIGSRWYHYLCAQRELDADALFPRLLDEYMQVRPRGPFNFPARRAAGFTPAELDWLRQSD